MSHVVEGNVVESRVISLSFLCFFAREEVEEATFLPTASVYRQEQIATDGRRGRDRERKSHFVTRRGFQNGEERERKETLCSNESFFKEERRENERDGEILEGRGHPSRQQQRQTKALLLLSLMPQIKKKGDRASHISANKN